MVSLLLTQFLPEFHFGRHSGQRVESLITNKQVLVFLTLSITWMMVNQRRSSYNHAGQCVLLESNGLRISLTAKR